MPASSRSALARVSLALLALLGPSVLAGCGETERARLGRELSETLAAAGYTVSDVEVAPPRGTVPHWNVDLAVDGDAALAEETCAAVERLAIYDGAPPYLIRVEYAGGVATCGTSGR